ncbi:MAG: met regulon transcriptional regulator MetJ [Rhodanobacter denitrificans]|uniref:Met repressor n=1 Tax=Rhodanobacter denitrificans TaxID=666685 RepID=A0A2W5M9P7_9GAMM|nr:MAG: met regulon transcriptional regulator MetJ [Rhodanobacter denitrificans]
MAASRFVDPYVLHGSKSGAVKKITVSIPLHILQLLSDERTRRQVKNLRHATNSDLLCEAFLHAFTGQKLPTDEELRRDMATAKKAVKKAAKKPAKKAAVKKTAVKKAAKKTVAKAKSATVKKTSAAKKPAAKKAVKKTAVKKTAAKKAAKK